MTSFGLLSDDAGCAEVNVAPCVSPAEILGILRLCVVQVLIILGCDIEPCSSPCLVVCTIVGIIEALRTLNCTLVVTGGEGIKCLCVVKRLLVTEVDIVQCEGGCILSSNIAGTGGNPDAVATLSLRLLLRRAPVTVVNARTAVTF